MVVSGGWVAYLLGQCPRPPKQPAHAGPPCATPSGPHTQAFAPPTVKAHLPTSQQYRACPTTHPVASLVEAPAPSKQGIKMQYPRAHPSTCSTTRPARYLMK